VDSLLGKAGWGLTTFGAPDSAGVPWDLARHTYVADFNHLDTVWAIVKDNPAIGCIILEPIMGNMGVIPPKEGFLKGVQEICKEKDLLLICDEVITGFRVTYGGAQHLYGIDPDITCLGKIIGGGFAIGAFGGRREIMETLAPLGETYQAGTLSGNPIAVRAGIYTLKYLKERRDLYEAMLQRIEQIGSSVLELARRYGVPYQINSATGMFTGFFSESTVWDYDSALLSSRNRYGAFFKAMLEEGIFFAPSQFEASIVTLCHGDDEAVRTVTAYDKVFYSMTSSR